MSKYSYFVRARLFPALLTSIPMLIFVNKIIAAEYPIALKNLYDVLPLIAHLGLSTAIIFLLVQINRFAAKEIFQRLYFKEELYMPTTNYLLMSNNFFPLAIKNRLRDKITTKFQIDLLDADKEGQDETTARQTIVVATSQIRTALRANEMLLQHNIEYGFVRNLIGGSLIAVVFSTAILLYGYFHNLEGQKTIAVICLIIYLIPVVSSWAIINKYGRYYAKILYEEFLTLV